MKATVKWVDNEKNLTDMKRSKIGCVVLSDLRVFGSSDGLRALVNPPELMVAKNEEISEIRI